MSNLNIKELFKFLYDRSIDSEDLANINPGKSKNLQRNSKDISIRNTKVSTITGEHIEMSPIICMDNCKMIFTEIDDPIMAEDHNVYIFNNYVFIEIKNNKHILDYNGSKNANGALSVGPITCEDGKVQTNYSFIGLFIGPTSHPMYDGDTPQKNKQVEVNLIYSNVCNPNIYISCNVYLENDSSNQVTTENALYSTILQSLVQDDVISKHKKSGKPITLSDLTSGKSCNPDISPTLGGCNTNIQSVNISDYYPDDHKSFISWLDIVQEHRLYWITIENSIKINEGLINNFLNKIGNGTISRYLETVVFNDKISYNKGMETLNTTFNISDVVNETNPKPGEFAYSDASIKFNLFYSSNGSISTDDTQDGQDAHNKNQTAIDQMCKSMSEKDNNDSTIVINPVDNQPPVLVELNSSGTAKSSLGEIMTASQLDKLNTNIKTLQEELGKEGGLKSTAAKNAADNLAKMQSEVQTPTPGSNNTTTINSMPSYIKYFVIILFTWLMLIILFAILLAIPIFPEKFHNVIKPIYSYLTLQFKLSEPVALSASSQNPLSINKIKEAVADVISEQKKNTSNNSSSSEIDDNDDNEESTKTLNEFLSNKNKLDNWKSDQNGGFKRKKIRYKRFRKSRL